jgi:hypothetical protein
VHAGALVQADELAARQISHARLDGGERNGRSEGENLRA